MKRKTFSKVSKPKWRLKPS